MILAVSDTHGNLPLVPACDVLIVAGDVSPLSFDREIDLVQVWLDTNFRKWLQDCHARGVKRIIGIAGNHDFAFERRTSIDALELPWTYLLDSGVEIDGHKYYGLPWVANLRGWAFYGDSTTLAEKYARIPDDTDVIVSHGPPQGYGDGGHPEWATSAANLAMQRIKPQAFICGHIHEGAGIYRDDDTGTPIFNVSFVDEAYVPQDRITQIEIPTKVPTARYYDPLEHWDRQVAIR